LRRFLPIAYQEMALPALIDRAIGFAARAHEGQHRKAGDIPYIAHPVAVAMMLQEMGCEPTVVAAGLLHDVVEDCNVTLVELRAAFGDEVADIVAYLTEPPRTMRWEQRKEKMIHSLRQAPLPVKLVAAADKYHNLQHTLQNQQKRGTAVWKRFGRGPEQQAWYYRQVTASILTDVSEPDQYPIFALLAAIVEELFAGVESQPPRV
jgi:(p)ppGpp synthase/HD superfamily hydrolase